jgi:2-polyprenyl-3-methyl-5-hydroxy-6-metoxy-1,4-benzoquinol methylase
MITSPLGKLYKNAESHNAKNICRALSAGNPYQRLLDIGCWDGVNTRLWAKAARAKEIYGLDAVSSAVTIAKKHGISATHCLVDSQLWPYKNGFIDCIVSNQVIEHLTDIDHFFSQASRVLAPSGQLVISTPNLASWHNQVSLLFGWAPFDLANSSSKAWGLGNPLSLHLGEYDLRGSTWTHKCVYTPKWLFDWGKYYHFSPVSLFGAGYYPLPSFFGNLDPTHAAFSVIVMKKI